jgi:4-amino-4-deoxy-L-arabinose transferase-like glycosyltransferase
MPVHSAFPVVIPHSAFRIPHLYWLAFVASLAIVSLYLWGLGGYGFLDPDEGMYAEIAREMLASGDWVIPRFNGVPYVEKPPLLYWLTAGTYAMLGSSEFSARLWKVVPILGTMVVTYGLGRRLFSEGIGMLSSLLLATTLGVFLFSRNSQMDPLLVFAITLSVFGIVAAALRLPGRAWGSGGYAAWCFWLGIGIGVMSKGLPGLFFPLALLALWTLVRRETGAMRGVWSWGGIAMALVLVVPWHVMAAIRVPGFFDFYVMDNQLIRFLGERAYVEDGKSLGTLAYLGITIYALFPWAPYLAAALLALCASISPSRLPPPASLSSVFRPPSSLRAVGPTGPEAALCPPSSLRAVGPTGPEADLRPLSSSFPPDASRLTPPALRFTLHDSRLQFLVGWIALVVGGFALSSFKLEYYALPAFPAVALFVAAFLASVGHAGKPGTPLKSSHPGASPVRDELSFRLLRVWTWVALVGGLLYTTAVAWAWWTGYFTPQNIVRGLSLWATNYRVVLEQGLPLPPVLPGYFGALLLGGGLLWVGGFAAALFWLRRGKVVAAIFVVAVVGVGLSAMAASVLRLVESHHSLKPLAERLNSVLQPGDVLVHERGLEKGGGLLFYTGRQFLVLNGTRGDLEFGSRLPGYERTFIDTDAFRNLWDSGSRVFLVTNLPEVRSAISAVSGPTPILVTSTGTRWLYSNRPL